MACSTFERLASEQHALLYILCAAAARECCLLHSNIWVAVQHASPKALLPIADL